MSTNSWLKELRIAAICVGGPLVIVPLLMGLNLLYVDLRHGPFRTEHYFEPLKAPKTLTREIALPYARQALARDGYDLTLWITQEEAEADLPPEEKTTQISQGPPTVSDPNRAVLFFVNKETNKRRTVFLDNNGKTLIVAIQKSKMD